MNAVLLAAVLATTLGLAGCGEEDPATKQKDTVDAENCRDQWREVGESVLGLDQDTDPSGLATRWTAVIASIDYYENSDPPADCADLVEKQTREISALRRFSESLRPYDMSHQVDQLRPGIALYLHDPLPEPARDETGNLVPPPTKQAVVDAFRTLTARAAAADSDLQPGWSRMSTVPLDDVDALRTAVTDLDALAQTSDDWLACEAALQVLVAAIRAQEGRA